MEEKRVKDLLVKAHDVIQQSKKIQMLKGENFNIFAILDRERAEVSTHSALLAELLNPKGSHGQGAIFLKHFFCMLNEKLGLSIDTSDIEDTRIKVELSVGMILEINTYLDIVLSNKNLLVCIENKIGAPDQPVQLERYKGYVDGSKHAHKFILYLTPEGKKYQENNTNLNDEEDYFKISYREHILLWLERCIKETVDYPILRESIRQYIILIKKITGQLTSNEMEKQLHKIILSDIESAEIVHSNYEKALKNLVEDFRKQIVEELKKRFPEPEFNIGIGNWRGYSSIFIKSTKYPYQVGIESFNVNIKGHWNGSLFIGLVDLDKKDESKTYINGPWIKNEHQIIYDRAELLEKLKDFANGTDLVKQSIVEIIIKEIEDFISVHYTFLE